MKSTILANIYYRCFYLKQDWFSRLATRIVRPSLISAEKWNVEYSSGQWKKLHDVAMQVHTALRYIEAAKSRTILEIGCGEGVLVPKLKQFGYDSYLGVDISDVAIANCNHLQDEHTSFATVDAENYRPPSAVDLIILNETVYYFADPIAVTRRLLGFLRHKVETTKNLAVLRRIKETFTTKNEAIITNRRGTWHCLLITGEI